MGQAEIIEFLRSHKGSEFGDVDIAAGVGVARCAEALRVLRRFPMGVIRWREVKRKAGGGPKFIYSYLDDFNFRFKQCFGCYYQDMNKTLNPCLGCDGSKPEGGGA